MARRASANAIGIIRSTRLAEVLPKLTPTVPHEIAIAPSFTELRTPARTPSATKI
jgi:hypothetical protein